MGKSAFIYLDGLNSLYSPLSVAELATRLCHALDHQAETRSATFVVGDRWAEPYGLDREASVARIVRRAPLEEPEDVYIDVYRVDALTELTKGVRDRHPLLRLLGLVYLLLRQVRSAVSAFFLPRGAPRKVHEILVSGFLVLLLALDGFVFSSMFFTEVLGGDWPGALADFPLVAGALDTVRGVFRALFDGSPALASIGGTVRALARDLWSGFWVAYGMAHIFVLAQPPEKVRRQLATLTTGTTALLEYVLMGQGRVMATSHVPALLEVLHGKGKNYDAVHLVGYSMGSLIALDTVFPTASEYPRALDDITTVTTVGCPLESLSAFANDYFIDRHATPSTERWLNVYLRSDPLASSQENENNFGIQVEGQQALLRAREHVEGVTWGKITRVGFWGSLVLAGMRTHDSYWEPEVESRSCFFPIVSRLYKGTPTLA